MVPSRLDMPPLLRRRKGCTQYFVQANLARRGTPAVLTVRTITTGPTASAPPNAVRGASEYQVARGRTEGRKLRTPGYSQLRFC